MTVDQYLSYWWGVVYEFRPWSMVATPSVGLCL